MSWFKRGRSESGKSRQSSDTASCNSDEIHDGRMRRDTDPDTCLQVFCNHWEQAYKVISSKMDPSNGKSTPDEIDAVSSNFEQMVTLLAEEEGEGGQGMPGPILHYLLEHEILEKFCGWCHRNYDDTGKLIKEQLRMFEHLISQSHQLLLIHKPVIRPLLNLLAYCADGCCSEEIEPSLVLVLHQVCISISKQTVILESFFNMNADHGPTKFLIFSLLIPYLHRDKAIGQQARDALLLIMALSSKHPHIGKYIAENSDFCPVLATGLSGLYSDLPRKIVIPSEEWYRITDEEVAKIPEMSMFLNTLEFCNAVAQIAHPLVRDQLINFIYNGFLVPVLGPALHQNSREEVITTTAYLDLFLRKVTEPSLIKAFLLFILTEKNDEIIILDSLITRINSSSKLSLVSLSLFHTLVALNCEDVMFELIFKHLIPCTHVMVSQRRAVRDLDLYSKSAEKFLSLRPTCCLPDIGESPKHSTEPKIEPPVTAFPPGAFGSKLEHFESNYSEYLHDARTSIRKCSSACRVWVYPYDGEKPPATSLDHYLTEDVSISDKSKSVLGDAEKHLEASQIEVAEVKVSSANEMRIEESGRDDDDRSKFCDSSNSAINRDKEELSDEDEDIFHEAVSEIQDSKYDNMNDFISMLEESDGPVDKSVNIDDSMKNLDSLITNISISVTESRTSTPRKAVIHDGHVGSKAFTAFCDNKDISSVCLEENTRLDTEEQESKQVDGTPFEIIEVTKSSKIDHDSVTEFEVINGPESRFDKTESKCVQETNNATEFVDITMPKSSDIQSHEQDSCNKTTDIDAKTDSNLSNNCTESFKSVDNWFGDSLQADQELKTDSSTTNTNTYPGGILVRKDSDQHGQIDVDKKLEKKDSGNLRGDKSVRFAASTSSMQKPADIIANPPAGIGISALKQGNESPTVGPLLTALLSKLDSMMQNSLPVNLVLTGLLARLATYPQPLLRSFFLNHNLVFQPTVKSLVQVLTSVRQKVDHYSYTVQNFEALLLRARRTLAQREGLLPERAHSLTPSPEFIHSKLRSSTINEVPSKDKRHRTLADLLFKRSPGDKKTVPVGKKGDKLEVIPGNRGFRYINKKPEPAKASQGESAKTRNAVYCAIVMEEFVKELAALSQEHSVLCGEDDGYSSC